MASRQAYQVPSGTDDGQRYCARDGWCSASTRDAEGTWHPALTYGPFCPADQSKITQDTGALPAACRRLAAAIGDPVRAGRAARQAAPASRVLLNADIDALLRTMAAVLGGWAARVRSVPGLNLARHGHPHGSAEATEADCAVLAAHTVPLLALPARPMTRTWTWHPGTPMPPDLDEQIGGLDAVHGGDGWVKAITCLSGEDAGLEILGLHRRAVRLLGETPAPPDLLDGIPCRSCEAMSLALAESPPPDPQAPPPPYSRCLECRAEMTRAEYDGWVRLYGAWTAGAGVQVCRRCDLGEHGDCAWTCCACTAAAHPRRRAAA